MKFHEQVREARLQKGLTAVEAAKMAGISVPSYYNVEYGNVSPKANTAQKVKQSKLFSRKITDVPDFYERLDSVCDGDGRIIVGENHPVLQELRMELGVEPTVYSRKEFGERLIRIREKKGLTQRETAKLVGLPLAGYTQYEYGYVKGKGKNYHKIISSELFKGEVE